MSATKLPAFFFYPSDWMTDLKVQSLTFEERGIWFAILCVMHEGEKRGKLTEGNKPMPRRTLAKLISCDLRKLNRVMDELLAKKVAYTDENGIIYNKRMVKDEALRHIRKECGSKGGNRNLVKQKNGEAANTGKPLSYSITNSTTNSERVQELRTKSVESEEWLDQTSAATGIPTPSIKSFCNNWITNAQLRYQLERYEINILIGFLLTDLQKEKPKLLSPPPLKIIDHLDMWVRK